MLVVIVANIDRSFTGVFDTDDEDEAAKMALANLIKHNGFFEDNVIVTKIPTSHLPDLEYDDQTVRRPYGILMLATDALILGEIEYALDDESTYWISVMPLEFGRMF